MEERRDGSAVLEFDIGRKPEATSDQNLPPGSGSAQKILEVRNRLGPSASDGVRIINLIKNKHSVQSRGG